MVEYFVCNEETRVRFSEGPLKIKLEKIILNTSFITLNVGVLSNTPVLAIIGCIGTASYYAKKICDYTLYESHTVIKEIMVPEVKRIFSSQQ